MMRAVVDHLVVHHHVAGVLHDLHVLVVAAGTIGGPAVVAKQTASEASRSSGPSASAA